MSADQANNSKPIRRPEDIPQQSISTIGAATSWAEIAAALNMIEAEAREGFRTWMTGQLDLHRRTGTITCGAELELARGVVG